jgi:hypothetical protein
VYLSRSANLFFGQFSQAQSMPTSPNSSRQSASSWPVQRPFWSAARSAVTFPRLLPLPVMMSAHRIPLQREA